MAKQSNNRKPIPFTLLDGSMTTYGFRVLVDGVDTTQFERNPVMFYNHRDYSLPIGLWSNVRKENGKLLADANFDYDDPDEEVQRIIGKVERGIIKMCSVGLRDNQWSDDAIHKMVGQTLPTSVKSRLREVSITAIGGNHNAIRLYDNEDVEIDLTDEIKLSDFIKPHKPKVTMNEELLKLLNLSDKADDQAVIGAITALNDKVTELTDSNKDLQDKLDELELADKEASKGKFEKDLNSAVLDGRINAAGKDHLISLYDSNPKSAQDFLDSIPKRQSVKEKIDQAGNESKTELSDLLAKTWDELDRSGKLITLKDSYPDAYVDKFKEKFGKAPDA